MDSRPVPLNIRFKLTTYWIKVLTALIMLISGPLHMIQSQGSLEVNPIKNLHEGTLIVRMPTYQAKIDTLKAFLQRSTDDQARRRFQKLLNETTATRDTLLHDYIKAFKENYTFSSVAWFYDYDARHLNSATYYNLDGQKMNVADLAAKPLFYLYFEHTQESKIDALVVYDRDLKIVPPPFPNNFIRGGLNFLFLKISEKNFPAWRVKRINRQFFKYYGDVTLGLKS